MKNEELKQLRNIRKRTQDLMKVEKCKLSKQYRKEHKGWFKLLDILFCLFFVFNFGALMLTTVMQYHPEWGEGIQEANPFQCKFWNPDLCNGKGVNGVHMLMKQSLIWAVVVVFYVYNRNTTYNQAKFYILLFMVIVYFTGSLIDFGNDFMIMYDVNFCMA